MFFCRRAEPGPECFLEGIGRGAARGRCPETIRLRPHHDDSSKDSAHD